MSTIIWIIVYGLIVWYTPDLPPEIIRQYKRGIWIWG